MFIITSRLEPACRWTLAAFFLFGAGIHLANPYEFLTAIYGYQIGGEAAGQWAALVIPLIMGCTGALLLFGIAVEGALIASIGLLLVFSAAQISVIARGITADCGCFGMAVESTVDFRTLARLGVLLAVAILGLTCTVARRKNMIEVSSELTNQPATAS